MGQKSEIRGVVENFGRFREWREVKTFFALLETTLK